jgi:hypothetical protein
MGLPWNQSELEMIENYMNNEFSKQDEENREVFINSMAILHEERVKEEQDAT